MHLHLSAEALLLQTLVQTQLGVVEREPPSVLLHHLYLRVVDVSGGELPRHGQDVSGDAGRRLQHVLLGDQVVDFRRRQEHGVFVSGESLQ